MLEYVKKYAENFKFSNGVKNQDLHKFVKLTKNKRITIAYKENNKYVKIITNKKIECFKAGDLAIALINDIPIHGEDNV